MTEIPKSQRWARIVYVIGGLAVITAMGISWWRA